MKIKLDDEYSQVCRTLHRSKAIKKKKKEKEDTCHVTAFKHLLIPVS